MKKIQPNIIRNQEESQKTYKNKRINKSQPLCTHLHMKKEPNDGPQKVLKQDKNHQVYCHSTLSKENGHKESIVEWCHPNFHCTELHQIQLRRIRLICGLSLQKKGSNPVKNEGKVSHNIKKLMHSNIKIQQIKVSSNKFKQPN